jgi:branched-chain amino acid transport system substrate-binding protein
VLGDKYDQMVIKTASYEVTDPTIDSQLVSLQSSGADVLISAATPKFAAMVIRKVYDLSWKPGLKIMSNVSASVGAVMVPAGVEKGVDFITAGYLKDPTDPTWDNDAGMKQWRGFMAQYLPDADLADLNFVYGFGTSFTLMQVLKQCGGDFSRVNVLRQATNLHNLVVPVALPGILVNTSPTNYHPMRAMQLQKWNGKTWSLFGSVIQGSQS